MVLYLKEKAQADRMLEENLWKQGAKVLLPKPGKKEEKGSKGIQLEPVKKLQSVVIVPKQGITIETASPLRRNAQNVVVIIELKITNLTYQPLPLHLSQHSYQTAMFWIALPFILLPLESHNFLKISSQAKSARLVSYQKKTLEK